MSECASVSVDKPPWFLTGSRVFEKQRVLKVRKSVEPDGKKTTTNVEGTKLIVLFGCHFFWRYSSLL
jgi:hypothetical protein